MSGDFLYKIVGIGVAYRSEKEKGHNLNIGPREYHLQRGRLDEFAKTPMGELEPKLRAWDKRALFELEEVGLSIDQLHFVLLQARIRELEEMMSSSMFEKRPALDTSQ